MALSRTLALAVLLTVPLAAQPREAKAMKALAKAVELAEKGKYQAAVATYKAVAKKYPNTGAGLLAQMRSLPTAFLGSADIQRTGRSSNRVDVVIMGDGYRLQDQNEFDDIAKTIPKLFNKDKVLGEYIQYYNFRRANLRSKDQGVTGFGRTKDTALGGHIAGRVQGQVGVDRRKVHQMLGEVSENDKLAICIVKAGSAGTGGAGIAAIGGRSDDTIVHEWGHAFGGLSDEYTSFTGHRGPARSRINISAYKDPKRSPWYHWIKARAPGVGMYRGGDGRIKGVWRPTASGCTMQGTGSFCAVCREAMVLKIHHYVDPIDWCSPDPGDRKQKWARTKFNGVDKPLRGKGPFRFTVHVMQPKTHGLHVYWFLLPAGKHIKATKRGPFDDRRRRGLLPRIAVKPLKTNSARRKIHKYVLHPRKLEPGLYQVVCRVQDRAKPSGQTWAWVLKDPFQLLWSERAWMAEVRR